MTGTANAIDNFTSKSFTIPGTIYVYFPFIKFYILFNALGEYKRPYVTLKCYGNFT